MSYVATAQQQKSQKSVEDWLGGLNLSGSEDFSSFENLEYQDPTGTGATSGWTSTGGDYTGGSIVGYIPTGLGGGSFESDFSGWTSTGNTAEPTPTIIPDSTVWGGGSAADSGSSWLSGWGDTLSDIGAGVSSFLGGLGFGGTSTQTPTQTTQPTSSGTSGGGGTIPAGGYQQASTGTATQAPAATEEKPPFIATEPGTNWLMNKLVIMGKFKIPYWFIIVLIGVIYWKRKQIMAVFKKK